VGDEEQYFIVPPPFLQESTGIHWNPQEWDWNPQESTESTGIGPESAGIHWNGTSKVQHSGYSPNGTW